MKDSEYHDLPGFDTIENSIRKPGHDGAAYISVHRRKHLGKLLDGIERRVAARTTHRPQPNPVQHADGRRLAGPLASPRFGEHFVSGNYVVWVASVFGETLVDYRAMGVTDWNRRGIRSNTLPDQLDEAQPLFDWEIKDFRDIGITHDR